MLSTILLCLECPFQQPRGKDRPGVARVDLGHGGDDEADESAAQGGQAEHPLAAEPGVQVAPEDLGQDVAHREAGEDQALLLDRPVELGVVLLKVSLKSRVSQSDITKGKLSYRPAEQ